jgi:ParB family transcriptional regulator, chromosome partitioning protein
MSNEKGRRLGRGLEALIPSGGAIAVEPDPSGELRRIPLSQIRPNPYQPRRTFEEPELAELTASIGASGLLQPISVRRSGGTFELISGERRLKAAGRLGWTDIPAIIRDVDDRTLLTLALIENLQRADLNAIEEAAGLKRLIDEFGYTQQQVADALGKDRTTITHLLRMLSLPAPVITLVEQGKLSAGHARALLSLSSEQDILTVATEAAARQFSVRETERRVRVIGGPKDTKASGDRGNRPTPSGGGTAKEVAAVRQVEQELRKRLQTDVHVKLSGAERGTIDIAFYSADDLERLLDLMLGASRQPF